MFVVCSLLAMIFVLLHCHPATKKLCPHAEVTLAFRDHGIITTSSNKTEPNVTYTNRLAGLQIRGGKAYFSIDFLEFSI